MAKKPTSRNPMVQRRLDRVEEQRRRDAEAKKEADRRQARVAQRKAEGRKVPGR